VLQHVDGGTIDVCAMTHWGENSAEPARIILKCFACVGGQADATADVAQVFPAILVGNARRRLQTVGVTMMTLRGLQISDAAWFVRFLLIDLLRKVAGLIAGEGKDVLELLLVFDNALLDVHREPEGEAGVVFVPVPPARVGVADLVERHRFCGGVGMVEKGGVGHLCRPWNLRMSY
jgi:hypothetical protein